MYDNNQIGAANYLNKSNKVYIPFGILMEGTDCKKILPMYHKIKQDIGYIDKHNKY